MKVENIFGEFPILETERLILRKIEMKDLDDLYEYSSNPNVAKYLSYLHKSKDEASEYIKKKEKQYESGKCMIWGIEFKEDKKYIGAVGFTHWDSVSEVAEIAYTLAEKYWKKGIAKESVNKIIQFGFEKMKLNRIEARCWKENEVSFKFMLKSGMAYEGTLREQFYAKGAYRDAKICSILKSEYNK